MLYAVGAKSLFPTPKPDTPIGEDLRVRRVDVSTSNISWHSNLSSLGELGFSTGSLRWVPGGLAFDTDTFSHWLATVRSIQTGRVYCVLTGYRGGYVLTETVLDPGPGNARIGGVSYDDDTRSFVLMAGDDGATGAVIGDVWQYPQASAEVLSGSSCHAATLSWRGPGSTNQQHTIGLEFGTIEASGARPGDLHFMVMSLATRDGRVSGPVASGCRLLVDATGPGYLGILDFRIGANVTWDQAVPEFLVADTIYFQDWIFDGSVFRSTHRMAVDIVK